ncbi:MAG: hypothetical protein PHY95_00855 [Candidatus ainarchaeum sp.]|nr:hypothetical protein [Candidatus ainarchaeum sp.]
MSKGAGDHRHGKPKKPDYVSPKKPFRKQRKAPLAALVTAAIIAAPGAARAGEISAPLPHKHIPAEKAARERDAPISIPDLSHSIDGSYQFRGGTATIEFTRMALETLDAAYRILFSVEGERYSPRFRFNAPPPNSLGSIVGVFVSEMHTVIITSNYIIVTQGYQDSLENPDTLLMHDGSRLERNSFHIRLPQGLRSGNINSCAAIFTPDGDIQAVFALGGGKLWSFRPNVEDGAPLSTEVSTSDGASLHSYREYVFLFQPDSTDDFVSIFKRTGSDEVSSEGTFRAERNATASEDPSVREVPGGMMFSSGNRTLIVLFDEGTGTFGAAASASD